MEDVLGRHDALTIELNPLEEFNDWDEISDSWSLDFFSLDIFIPELNEYVSVCSRKQPMFAHRLQNLFCRPRYVIGLAGE